MNHALDLNKPPAKPLISASILSADFGRMADECRSVLDAGADMLHVDVMDGHFVPNLTMGQDMIRGLRKHLPHACLDVHLMVERPSEYVAAFANAGADVFTFHLEVTRQVRSHGEDASSLIDRIHSAGMYAGMSINPPTAIAPIEPLLPDLDLVLVMSVNPGRSGQAFMPTVLPKVRWLRPRVLPGTRIEMDGGLNPETAAGAVEAGVDIIVTASALFGSDDRAGVIRALKGA